MTPFGHVGGRIAWIARNPVAANLLLLLLLVGVIYSLTII